MGLPPGGTQRILRVGIDMNADEKVTTKADDRAHLVFLDGTSLTIGPNSEVIIDKYVYDPAKKTGEMALKVQRGTMRFVGGVISKTSEVKVETPSARMGIRGGIFTVSVTALGATTANFLYGQRFTMTSQGVTKRRRRPARASSCRRARRPRRHRRSRPAASRTTWRRSRADRPLGPGGRSGRQPPGPDGRTRRRRSNPGGRSGSPGGQGPGGRGNQGGANIGSALANAGLGKVNSTLPPAVVLANTPTHSRS